MKRLLSKSSNRRLDLINTMQRNRYEMNIETLANQLNCSERTLKEDIAFMNTAYSDYLSIYSSNNTVVLKTRPYFSYEVILKQKLSNSLPFNLLENIFFNETKNINQLAEVLYTSPATLYRQVRTIKNILKQYYDISLETNPFHLVGDEEKIRNFFTELFSEKYSLFDWPFEGMVDEKELERFILLFIEQLPLLIDFAYFRNMKIIIAINIMRYKQGHRVKHLSISRDEFLNETLRANNGLQHYSRVFGTTMDLDFLREIYSDFATDEIAFSSEELVEKAQENRMVNKSYFGLLNMVNKLARQYNLKISNKDIVITNLNNSVFLAEKELFSNYLIYDRKINFLHSIEEEFPDFYESVQTQMREFLNDVFSINDSQFLNTMVLTLLTNWYNLIPQLLNRRRKVSVLIMSNSDFLHAYMIRDILAYKLPEYINFEVKEDVYISMAELVESDYDIIISTFSLGVIENKKTLCIENMPTEEEIDILMDMIDDILL